jgi:hypothetical protein
MGRLKCNASAETPRHTTAVYQLSKKLKRKEGSVETDPDYEHLKVKDYLAQQHRNSKNF